MKVSEALDSRLSVRAFTDQPVAETTIRDLLAAASRSPSGGNLQPWKVYVLTGDALDRFKTTIAERTRSEPMGRPPEYNIYPPKLTEPYRSRRSACGQALYDLLGIAKDDKAGKLRQLAQNFTFFGAPVAMFFAIDRQMDKNGWAHLGMFMQSIMLLAREHGLDTCPQEAWAVWHHVIGEFVDLPDELMLYCGMALGHRDESAAVNRLRTDRAGVDDFATFLE